MRWLNLDMKGREKVLAEFQSFKTLTISKTYADALELLLKNSRPFDFKKRGDQE